MQITISYTMEYLHGFRKQSVSDLAIFGGAPAFPKPIHVGTPNIGDRSELIKRFDAILDRRLFSNNGPCVQEFESRIVDMIGVRNCIATSNGTTALEILIRAVGLTGEVLVPSFTFVATAHALQWQQITPVFCEIDPRTHSLDVQKMEKMVTPRTTGIIGVHTWGEPCAIHDLTDFASRKGLKLLFDASHAFGCSHANRMIGSFGIAEAFSFHATKFINAFEGGVITTNDDSLAAKLRLMRNFGFSGYDRVLHLGINGKMSEVSAAMGLCSLESMTEIVDVNRSNYAHYREHLDSIPGLSLFVIGHQERRNYQYVVIEVNQEIAGISRNLLVEILHAEGVLVRKYFYPGCHRMEPYRSLFPHARLLLGETEALCDRIMILPTGQTVTRDTIDAVCHLLRLILGNSVKVNALANSTVVGNTAID